MTCVTLSVLVLLVVALVEEVTSVSDLVPPATQYWVVTPPNGNATIDTCRLACRTSGVGGWVATVKNAYEQRLLYGAVNQSLPSVPLDPYVGALLGALRSPNNRSEFRWAEGPLQGTLFWVGLRRTSSGAFAIGYTNFNSLEPTDTNSNEDSVEICRSDGTWNDIHAPSSRVTRCACQGPPTASASVSHSMSKSRSAFVAGVSPSLSRTMLSLSLSHTLLSHSRSCSSSRSSSSISLVLSLSVTSSGSFPSRIYFSLSTSLSSTITAFTTESITYPSHQPLHKSLTTTRIASQTGTKEYSPTHSHAVLLPPDILVPAKHRPLPPLAANVAVQMTDRAATWLGTFGGGYSTGSTVSRVAAVRSLLLCSEEGASTGGLLGLSLPRPSDDDGVLLASARGAIVGNTLVLVVWLVTLVALAAAYYYWMCMSAGAPATAACVRVALPSSLLPLCAAILPSTSGGLFILAVAGASALNTVDVVTLVAGGCVLTAVLIPLLLLCAPSFATKTLHACLVTASLREGNEGVVSCIVLLWSRAIKPRWRWRPLLLLTVDDSVANRSPRKNNDEALQQQFSLAARGCSVILAEHRCLWYAALDMWLLSVTGMLGAASGVMASNPAVCSGAAIALTVLFLLQFVVVVIVRPFTSVFANMHTAFVLLLTGVGTAMQAASIVRRGFSSDPIEEWALLGAAVCGFLVVGASMTRVVLVDAPTILAAGMMFLREIRAERHEGASAKPGSRASASEQMMTVTHISEDHSCSSCEKQATELLSCTTEGYSDVTAEVDALNCCFWDDLTGSAAVLLRHEDDGDATIDEHDRYREGKLLMLDRFCV